uniref:Ig-like domain-containing protein n=1 Tax=Seriola lalandi dorsalis TaxID=1841481 RepID=A0A3B4XLG1_SERLL
HCSQNVSLKCSGDDIDKMDFLSVTWYKLKDKGQVGIIRRDKGENITYPYDSTSVAQFGENYSLLLPRVKPEDSGTYECAISADIGRQNLNFKVSLTVHECVTQPELTTMATVSNTTQSILSCQIQVEDLPVIWSITGYVAVSIVKILLCVISIWVIRIRSSNQEQRRW